MESDRFDAISKSFAERSSRRRAIGLGSALLGLVGVRSAEAADPKTCVLKFSALVTVGSDRKKKFEGDLTVEIGSKGAIDNGTLVTADGISHPVVGQTNGRAVDLRIAFDGGAALALTGIGEHDLSSCKGKVDGTFGGPQSGDSGTWSAVAKSSKDGGSGPTPASSAGNSSSTGSSGTTGGGGGGAEPTAPAETGGGGTGSCLPLQATGCTVDSDCCDANVCRVGGDLMAFCAACSQPGGQCGNDSQCCEGSHCGANECISDVCSDVGGPCTTGFVCCDTVDYLDCAADGTCQSRPPEPCGGPCQPGEECVNNVCQAAAPPDPCLVLGLTSCNGGCVDTSSDASNCGSCGSVCSQGDVCQSNICQT